MNLNVSRLPSNRNLIVLVHTAVHHLTEISFKQIGTMALLRARFRRNHGLGHEDRVLNRDTTHRVKVSGSHASMLYATTRGWIHSWDEVGDNDLRIDGVDWEFLACEGVIYPEDSTVRSMSVFDYSLHPSASASILSRILELGSFSHRPSTEVQYLQAVCTTREANMDDARLQVSDTDLYKHAVQGGGFVADSAFAAHLQYRHLILGATAVGMPDFLRCFGSRFIRGVNGPNFDADATSHRCSIVATMLKVQLSEHVGLIRHVTPHTLQLIAKPIGDWLQLSPFPSSLCTLRFDPRPAAVESVLQEIDERLLFKYGTDSDKVRIFESRFSTLLLSDTLPLLTKLLAKLSSSEAFRQYLRITRKLLRDEPTHLVETARQVELILVKKQSVMQRALDADSEADAFLLISKLLESVENVEQLLKELPKSDTGTGAVRTARGGYTSQDMKVVAEQVATSSFASHSDRVLKLYNRADDPNRFIRIIREALHFRAAFTRKKQKPKAVHTLLASVVLSGRDLTGLDPVMPVLLEARPFLLQYFTRALLFGDDLGLDDDSIDYKLKNIRLKASVATNISALRLGDIDIVNDIAYFLKGKRNETSYAFVSPGDELTVATHSLELRMVLPNFYEMLGLPGSGDGTHLDVLDKIIQLVTASDFLMPELRQDFFVHMSSISDRTMEAITSHLQTGLLTRNAARVFSRNALELAEDVYEHIQECHALLQDFLRFHRLLPSMFPTGGSPAKTLAADSEGHSPPQ